ncbi:ATP-binding cassette domain-containing protein [Actinomadura oligospora]|uniref:ATP-binding cassette domain-containing protein n=1 Tax=Actinomadura oligospora TaxID=111804 RepID=UPI001FE1376D|nr:ATP-binding cassette domain-containing protein [Actinomadura oligospora]
MADDEHSRTPAADGASGGNSASAAGSAAPAAPAARPAAVRASEGGRRARRGRTAGAPVRVTADGLAMRGRRGMVYSGVTFDVPAGGLLAVSGAGGTGRTALLLTLGGRMRPTEGGAEVGPFRLPGDLRAVQRISALGIVPGVNELDPALTVREHLGEALDLHEGMFGRWRGRAQRARHALERVGLGDLDVTLPAGDLTPEKAQLLGAACALVGRPGLLLLDDVDEGLPLDRQRALWERLRAVADSGVTVVASCQDPAPARGLALELRLETPR